MDEEGTQRADSQNDTESAPLLVEEVESHSEPVMTSSDSTAVTQMANSQDGPPPAYNEAPPPYSSAPSGPPPSGILPPGLPSSGLPPSGPPPGVLGEPTVMCRVCNQLIFIRGRENQRVVKCASCHEATPIKPPPHGKKYIRCPCNALLTCRSVSTRISCPRANCKRIINVGGPPSATAVPPVQSADARIRVTCGHCNETFVFRVTAHLARCPYCRRVSSVGSKFARTRSIIFAVVGLLFLIAGVAVTVTTLEVASSNGGIYVIWIGAFVAGILNLIRSCYYCSMTVSKIEGQA